MKILIATKNEGKILGAKQAFHEYFNEVEIEGISVSSNVSEEPINNEIYLGAHNRVENLIKYAKENHLEAEYFLGIESGITNLLGTWINISIAVIKDKNGVTSWGTSAGYPIPDKYLDEIKKSSLGKVMDRIFKQEDLGNNKGGISYLTHNVIKRVDLTKEAFIMALTKLINEEIWK